MQLRKHWPQYQIVIPSFILLQFLAAEARTSNLMNNLAICVEGLIAAFPEKCKKTNSLVATRMCEVKVEIMKHVMMAEGQEVVHIPLISSLMSEEFVDSEKAL